MKKHTLRVLAVSATYFALNPAFASEFAAAIGAATTSTTSVATDAATLPATRIASRFESLAGSPENAASLVAGLRSGSEITLTSPDSATGISFTPTTRPMGYGNITRALTLAQRQLAAQGITQPTPEQLNIALNGGSLTTLDGSGASGTVQMPGVLQLRSQGMGWGQIAHQLSVSPGNSAATTASPAGTATTGTMATTQGRAGLHGSSYGRGAIVSGDGSIMRGRVPGYSSTPETRGQWSGTAQALGNGKAMVNARAPLIQAGSSASLGGGYAIGATGKHGKTPVLTRSHGRI